MTPSAARPQGGRAAPASYIGFPQRFCEAKDLWEEGGGGKGASAQNVVFAVRQIPEKSALNGAPKKDFWEKEEQTLKTWCLPSGKYSKRAP